MNCTCIECGLEYQTTEKYLNNHICAFCLAPQLEIRGNKIGKDINDLLERSESRVKELEGPRKIKDSTEFFMVMSKVFNLILTDTEMNDLVHLVMTLTETETKGGE